MSSVPPNQQGVPRLSREMGKYRILGRIGRGGMAEVFLALVPEPRGCDKLVVIKRMLERFEENERVREMFLLEARLAAQLNHPNVVQTFETDEYLGNYFIAMEYLEGQPLKKLMVELKNRGERFPPKLALRIIVDVLKGLEYAHQLRDQRGNPLKLVHRDVSPHNIFICYDGQVKLVDFGIAKSAGHSLVTDTGVLKGKVSYMAPEQVLGVPIDLRTDLFSTGIVLWELLAQREMFRESTPAATVRKLMSLQAVPPPSEFALDVHPELDALVLRALQPKPDARYQSALQMREALEAYLRRAGNVRQQALAAVMNEVFHAVRERMWAKVRAQMDLVREPAPPAGVRHPGNGEGEAAPTSTLPTTCSFVALVSLPPSDAQGPRERQASPAPRRPTLHSNALLVLAPVFVLFFLWGWASRQPRTLAHVGSAGEAVSAPGPVASSAATLERRELGAPAAAISADPVQQVPPPGSGDGAADEAAVRVGPGRTGGRGRTPAGSVRTLQAPAPKMGFLTIDSAPRSKVSVGARTLGTTPISQAPLPPGRYSVVLANAEDGLRRTVDVTIRSGEATWVRVPLR